MDYGMCVWVMEYFELGYTTILRWTIRNLKDNESGLDSVIDSEIKVNSSIRVVLLL